MTAPLVSPELIAEIVRGVQEGTRAAERAAIVAYLRGLNREAWPFSFEIVAGRIERGEHAKPVT